MAPSELGESSPKRLKGESWEKVGEGVESVGSAESRKSEESEYIAEGNENDTTEEGDRNEESEDEGSESHAMEEDIKIETDEEDLTDDDPLSMKNKEYRAKLKAYRKQIEESEGFETDLFPGFAPGLEGDIVVPCDLDEQYYDFSWTYGDVANDISLLAIELLNRFKPNVKLELVEVVKANKSHPLVYKITFKAKDLLSPTLEEKEYRTTGGKVGALEACCFSVEEKNDIFE